MKLLTPYGISDYIAGGIVNANRGEWEIIVPLSANVVPISTEDYDLVSYTDPKTGRKTWFYRK